MNEWGRFQLFGNITAKIQLFWHLDSTLTLYNSARPSQLKSRLHIDLNPTIILYDLLYFPFPNRDLKNLSSKVLELSVWTHLQPWSYGLWDSTIHIDAIQFHIARRDTLEDSHMYCIQIVSPFLKRKLLAWQTNKLEAHNLKCLPSLGIEWIYIYT